MKLTKEQIEFVTKEVSDRLTMKALLDRLMNLLKHYKRLKDEAKKDYLFWLDSDGVGNLDSSSRDHDFRMLTTNRKNYLLYNELYKELRKEIIKTFDEVGEKKIEELEEEKK